MQTGLITAEFQLAAVQEPHTARLAIERRGTEVQRHREQPVAHSDFVKVHSSKQVTAGRSVVEGHLEVEQPARGAIAQSKPALAGKRRAELFGQGGAAKQSQREECNEVLFHDLGPFSVRGSCLRDIGSATGLAQGPNQCSQCRDTGKGDCPTQLASEASSSNRRLTGDTAGRAEDGQPSRSTFGD